jgi:hypothetical protein
MTIVKSIGIFFVTTYSVLLAGPVFGMPLIGDLQLHATLIFHVWPAGLIMSTLALMIDDIVTYS